MKKKIILIFVVLLFSLGIAFAENNTTESIEIEDNVDYILPISITNEGIKFDDGFIGFCIDSTKSNIETSDNFTLGVLGDSEIENNIKLAIIECYKQGKEDAMADILSQIDDKGSNNDVLNAVFNSDERIGDTAVVNIDNTTEATFEFEFLKSSDDAKSDCVAYKVSMKTIENEDVLAATTADEGDNSLNNQQNDVEKTTEDNTQKTDTTNNEKTEENEKLESDNQSDVKKATEDKNAGNDNTKTNETNKTIINKTNTVIVNENNTTIINHNNVKKINDTKDVPQNDTVQDLLKAGNPILILIIVIVVIVLAVVIMRRKD